MRRLSLLTAVLFSGFALAEEPSPVLDEARAVMREGLERDLPAPSAKGPPQWPSATQPAPVQGEKNKKDEAPGQLKKDALGERVRNEASLRARAAAEERRAAPENNNQGASQNRTRAAKGQGQGQGPRPKPPKP